MSKGRRSRRRDSQPHRARGAERNWRLVARQRRPETLIHDTTSKERRNDEQDACEGRGDGGGDVLHVTRPRGGRVTCRTSPPPSPRPSHASCSSFLLSLLVVSWISVSGLRCLATSRQLRSAPRARCG